MESITLPIAVWLSWLGPCANKKRWFELPGNQSALPPSQAPGRLLLGSPDTAPLPSLIYHKLPLLSSALLMPLFLPLLAPVIPPARENHTIVQVVPTTNSYPSSSPEVQNRVYHQPLPLPDQLPLTLQIVLICWGCHNKILHTR